MLAQVVAEYFYPVSGGQGQQAVAAERSVRVQTRLNNIRDAIAVTQWADALPHVLLFRAIASPLAKMRTLKLCKVWLTVSLPQAH